MYFTVQQSGKLIQTDNKTRRKKSTDVIKKAGKTRTGYFIPLRTDGEDSFSDIGVSFLPEVDKPCLCRDLYCDHEPIVHSPHSEQLRAAVLWLFF